MLDAAVEDVPVEGRLELRAVVGLDHLDPEGELLEHVVDELDVVVLMRLGVIEPTFAAGVSFAGCCWPSMCSRSEPSPGCSIGSAW